MKGSTYCFHVMMKRAIHSRYFGDISEEQNAIFDSDRLYYFGTVLHVKRRSPIVNFQVQEVKEEFRPKLCGWGTNKF